MALSSRKAAPIVVLHGGPSVASDYLYPLQDHIPYRSLIFYDQIGCGRSSEPEDPSCYSIDYAIDDLEALLKKLGVRRFHLYGQSYGGILGFEYLKRRAEQGNKDDEGCLSVVLSSTPCNVTQVEQEANRLVEKLDGADNLAEAFRKAHQCQTPEKPQPLVDAYAHAGTVWRGTEAISDYSATPPLPNASRMPSAMVLRGEDDFVTEKCIHGWKEAFCNKFIRFKVLPGCSHHGLLENGPLYGEVIDSFFAEYD
jgi:proline iminopeptidase